ncbi:helix-turn-helix domain-containing protein [Methylococcus sp. Mc7]|uniref:AraC-like ligand-binding domain-containing protein n=1 Tax=Methylococcus sp. Mc7 TaxID=2860258 RepID=UPI001C532FA2|nr:helix-turn-helix domain-containing protein [Methylococcus sp. Mc7]QXP85750.1 helix-turn-helix domain-containing protein [Methylococcus sp. Mc7]
MAEIETNPQLPFLRFSTDAFPEEHRCEAWAEMFLTEIPASENARRSFSATLEGYRLDQVAVASISSSPCSEARDRRQIARDDVDHYLIHLPTAGGYEIRVEDGREIAVATGDVCVLDSGKPFRMRSDTTMDLISVVLPRNVLNEHLGSSTNLHGVVLPADNARGVILATHLRTLKAVLPGLTVDEAGALARGTAALAAACLALNAGNREEAVPVLTSVLKTRAMHYIEAHLESADLTPERICRALNISRAHLYRAFQEQGGVAKYVLRCRLERAYTNLQNPAMAKRTVSSIAFECGFCSVTHFSRAFRAAFGISPSDAREISRSVGQKTTAWPFRD